MTDKPTNDDLAHANIDLSRRLFRRLAAKLAEKGIAPIDIAIGATYAAHDLAMHAGHDATGAIEWIRTALDLQERQLFEREA